MNQEKKQAIALMRYSAIAPLISGTQDDFESLSAYFRTVSAKVIRWIDDGRKETPEEIVDYLMSFILTI